MADRVSPRRIIEHVLRRYTVEYDEMVSRTRAPQVVRCRDAVVYALRETTGMSYPEIARAMGRTGHTAMMQMYQRACRWPETERRLLIASVERIGSDRLERVEQRDRFMATVGGAV